MHIRLVSHSLPTLTANLILLLGQMTFDQGQKVVVFLLDFDQLPTLADADVATPDSGLGPGTVPEHFHQGIVFLFVLAKQGRFLGLFSNSLKVDLHSFGFPADEISQTEQLAEPRISDGTDQGLVLVAFVRWRQGFWISVV